MNTIKLSIHFESHKTLNTLFTNQVIYSCISAKYAHKIAELTPLRTPKTVLITDKSIEINQVVLLDLFQLICVFQMNLWLFQILAKMLFLVQRPSASGVFNLILKQIQLMLKRYNYVFNITIRFEYSDAA